MNKILIDYGIENTTLWFKDGFTTLKGGLMEIAEKIYNIATVKIINKDTKDYYINQEHELYIDYLGYGQLIEDILINKYNLKVKRCNVYKNHKDYNSDNQQVIEVCNKEFNCAEDTVWSRNKIIEMKGVKY